jgi:hypothetical protein
MSRLLALALCFLAAWPAPAQVDERAVILERMKRLQPLIGAWSAVARFHGPERTNDGTYLVYPVLGGTYLEIEVELRRREDHARRTSFLLFITWDPRAARYAVTYFYSGTSLRVTEAGEFDEATGEFRTQAFIPLEDGVRDEQVRTILTTRDPARLVYTHFSRYSTESEERNDLTITLTRV